MPREPLGLLGRDPAAVAREAAIALDALLGVALDHGRDVDAEGVGLADDEHLDGAGDAFEQRVGDGLVDEHARGGRALLAGVDEGARDDGGDGVVEVGVGVDDDAVLAAHLGHDALEVRGRCGSAAARMMLRPTGPEPVKAIVWTPGWPTSAAPVSPSPGTRASASGGTPASLQGADDHEPQPGACSAGLRTTLLPVASPAAVMPIGMAIGKFHGATTATTPRGA